MKLQKRNCVEFEYLPYNGLTSDIDENGFHTGVPVPQYGNPVVYTGNISAPSGSVVQAYDGLEIRYSHILLMDNPDVNIREEGKIRFKNRSYTIKAVRPSMNVFSAALLADTVDYGDQLIDEEDEG